MIAAAAATAEEVIGPLEEIGDQFVAMLPKAAVVVGVLVVGLVIAWVLRRVTRWLVRKTGLEALGEKIGASRVLYAVGSKGSLAHLLGTLVWFATLLVTLAVIAEMLGLPGLAEATSALTAFLPRLIAAGFIIAVGMFVADLTQNLVTRVGAERSQLDSPRLVGQILYYTILTVAVTMAVQQIGLETALINTLIAIGAAAVAGSVGLALALGSREIVASFVARYYVRGFCRPGDKLRVGDVEGVVVRFTPTSVVIQDGARHHVVPCARLTGAQISVERLPEAPDAAHQAEVEPSGSERGPEARDDDPE